MASTRQATPSPPSSHQILDSPSRRHCRCQIIILAGLWSKAMSVNQRVGGCSVCTDTCVERIQNVLSLFCCMASGQSELCYLSLHCTLLSLHSVWVGRVDTLADSEVIFKKCLLWDCWGTWKYLNLWKRKGARSQLPFCSLLCTRLYIVYRCFIFLSWA